LPNGTTGVTYSASLSASGDAPITWSLQSGSLPTGLTLTGNVIGGTPTTAGTANHSGASVDGNGNTGLDVGSNGFNVVVTAEDGVTKKTYTLNIVRAAGSQFVAVTGITDVPTSATAQAPLVLTGTVNPSNATNQTIIWSVRDAGTTGATIGGNTLTATAAGTVTVTATIVNGATATTNYTQDFSINVSPPTGNETIEASALKARAQNGTLYMSGLTAGQPWAVYRLSGVCLYRSVAQAAEAQLPLPERGVYIIITNGVAVKVMN
jgi:hypothetical protein